jgi:hypothetical protein
MRIYLTKTQGIKEHKAYLKKFLSENVNGTGHLGQLGEKGRKSLKKLGENEHWNHRTQHMVPRQAPVKGEMDTWVLEKAERSSPVQNYPCSMELLSHADSGLLTSLTYHTNT